MDLRMESTITNDPGCDDDPGVINIPRQRTSDRHLEEDSQIEIVDLEEQEEKIEQSPIKGTLEMISGVEQLLCCQSVRIGSFKVRPKPFNTTMNVHLASDGISFNAPMVSDCSKIVNITLKPSDIIHMLVHFCKHFNALFVITTASFAEAIRESLNMTEKKFGYYDPTSNDKEENYIIFLIKDVYEEQQQLTEKFVYYEKTKIVDHKTANEILVNSTPGEVHIVWCKAAQPQPSENLLSVTTMQTAMPKKQKKSREVIRIVTYPPAPQPGGILITNEDLKRLEEKQYLNDSIIDFYLKWYFNEKLSEEVKQKSYLFSTYFFSRLTVTPKRKSQEAMPEKVKTIHYNQVKSWTRKVDIFSKDFIIIPIHDNDHFYLAIVCYAGLVPEALESSDHEHKQMKEASSTVFVNNENPVVSKSSMFEQNEPDSKETLTISEAASKSTHPEQVCQRKEVPCVCIFDSLFGQYRSSTITLLQHYLEIEWKMKKGTQKFFNKNTMQGNIMQCPQQKNKFDCGLYVLQYVESFFENPIASFTPPIHNLSNWFTEEKILKKRKDLKDLIISLQKKHSSTAYKSIRC